MAISSSAYSTTVRIVTWNVATARKDVKGRYLAEGPALDAVAEVLGELDPDVVAVQELDRGIDRTGYEDQPGRLGEALGMKHWFAPTLRRRGADGPWEPVDRPGQDSGEAAYGMALFSRLPLEDVEACALPLGPRPYRGQEPRVALAATVRAGSHRLTLAAAHLDRRPRRAAPQLRHLRGWLATRPAPRMVVGDLNLRPWRVGLATWQGWRWWRRDWRRAVRGLTQPAGRAFRQIDHVLLDPAALRVRAARVIRVPVSDHRAVLVEIEIGPGR